MIFLNPAVLLGLLAASIPILIHLFNLRKLKKIEFSTLTFLKELQKNKIRKVKLKQWLLLLLRVFIILFLVFAFARPTLEGVAIGGTTSVAKTTSIFILDDTFSMSVIDQKGSLFNQAKQAIKKILNNFQEGDEVGIILVTNHNSESINLTSDFAEFEQLLETTEISYASGVIHDSFAKAVEVVSGSKNFNKEIYILSDFQSGRLMNDDDLTELGGLLDDNTRIYAINFSEKDIFNLSIDKFEVNTSIFEKEKPISFSAIVTNHSKQTLNNNVISIYLNDVRSSQQSISLNPGESKMIEIEAVAKQTGFIDIRAEIEDDDIDHDNQKFLSIYIPDKIQVLLSADNKMDLNFIRLSLETGNMFDTYKVDTKSTYQLLSTGLDDYDVLFLVGEDVDTGFDRIKNFVQEGKGMIVFPSSTLNLERFNRLLENIGIPKAENHIGNPNRADNQTRFQETDFNHPLLENIFQAQEKISIESPEIFSYYKILSGTAGKNIIGLPDGSDFLSEYRIGKGKILLFNSAPVLSWNTFPLKGLFPALINKSVLYLATEDQNGINYLAGDPININIRNAKLPQLKVIMPDGIEDIVNLTGEERGDFLIYRDTKMAGNYEIFSDDQMLEDISVNTDPSESITEYLSGEDLREYSKKINFKGTFITMDKNDNPVNIILQARFGSELWKYFLLMAIFLALLEMTLARNIKKELEGL
jgi:hypothetical protein